MDPIQEGTDRVPVHQPPHQDASSLSTLEESILDVPLASPLPTSSLGLPSDYYYDFSPPNPYPFLPTEPLGPAIGQLGERPPLLPSFHIADPPTEPQWTSSLPPLAPAPAQRFGFAGPWISRFAAPGNPMTALNDAQRQPYAPMFTPSSQRPHNPQYFLPNQPLANEIVTIPPSHTSSFSAYRVHESPTGIPQRQIFFMQPETTATFPQPAIFNPRPASPDIYPQPGPARVLRQEEFASVSEQIASISQTERFLRAELRAKGVDIPEHVPLNLDALEDTEDGSKPPYELGILLRLAIWGSERRMMLLSEMKSAIEKRFAWYRGQNDSWKQSIRHKLSLKAIFVQRKRSEDSPGRGAYWTIDIRGGNCESRKRKKRKRQKGGPSRNTAATASRSNSARAPSATTTQAESSSTASQWQDSGSQQHESSDEDNEA